jgi:DNA sulfur modification protein DndD
MIIKSLKLHNFGVYANDNVFEFKSNKPVVLIGGLNGRGKTTFLEAVLLALYGANSFAYKESKYRTFGKYLGDYVNEADGTLETFVELEFRMDFDNYKVKRSWSKKQTRIHEQIEVYKNGDKNEFLTTNWAMFIENVLPSGLASFFFFDGEKIAALAEDETSEEVKISIKAMLGISVLDVLKKDLRRILARATKETVSKEQMEEMENLRRERDASAKALENMDYQIREHEEKINEKAKEIENLNSTYATIGGDVIDQRRGLMDKKAKLSAELEHVKSVLADEAGSSLPLHMVKDLLFTANKQSEAENEQKTMKLALKKVMSALDGFKSQQNDTYSAEEFVSYLKNETEKEKIEEIYNLSDTSLFRLSNLVNQDLDKNKERVKELIEDEHSLMKKLDEIESYLSVEIDEKQILKLYKDIKKAEQQKIQLEAELEQLQSNRSSVNGSAIHSNATFRKFVDELLGKLEANDDSERVIKYANKAIKILDEYEIRLQKRKTDILAKTMTDCYHKLANKTTLIEHIRMNPETLDFRYLDYRHQEVEKKKLSAGEKQLMVISLLWALAICSKKKLPVIIDTPLARLDSNHRTALVKTYFPKASEQTIILSTDSEIDERYYNMMKKNVGDEFLLHYDDVNKNTTIYRGYFKEAN